MNWTYSIKNKLAASGILLLLFILVLASNYIDRNHTDNVKNAISTLYEDRLIAEEYILKMTSGVYQIREVIHSDANDVNKVNWTNNLLLTIKEANNAYQKTKFTLVEKAKAQELEKIVNEFESILLRNTPVKLEVANKALNVLNQLSTIQLEESKKIMDYAETLYVSGKTSSQFVFALIIVILFALQAIVFTSKSLIPRNKPKSASLN
ncbi:hypothetical protein [Flavobacterium sp.]|uniref:hypothetical protein n=1 Tax=Flavobacterium sp. TaxID=239 RepID=UPI00248A84A9|nr:hypothetical protein [Flavobacterium sp.]MDI1317224.1 hypothetical protein [Flavobacterium sp.]